ncbi:MAG: Rpn family recombination-promoting nuclease/putative transposase [Synechococcaceae cyanobacterium SM2_3_2]|nr:Rpn family recombination-promoting nuclease/putative transposase [Synechococcaceae cyanobacterium SM2_3_2]
MTIHDQFAKSLLSEFLEPYGRAVTNLEVSNEPRFVDLYFEPTQVTGYAHASERASGDLSHPRELGLLGQMARISCLIEPFRNPVDEKSIQSCLLKALMIRAKQQRQGSQTDPYLWILTPTASERILALFGAVGEQGMYHLPAGLNAAIVVIHQLPRTRETLWIRLLGREGFQKRAIEEVIGLPTGDPSRRRVLELLGNWKIMLDEKTEAEREEERELMMNLSPAYLKWKEETLNEGKEEGIQLGKQEGIQLGKQEGIQIGKLETVPILAELGLSVSDIAQRLDLPAQLVAEMLAKQNS